MNDTDTTGLQPIRRPEPRELDMTQAYVAAGPGAPMNVQWIDLGPLAADQVEVAVEHCGLCRSDLAMWHNEWGLTRFPFVAGHEVVGRVTRVGASARGLVPGQRVGLGWNSGSCLCCNACRSGQLQYCPDRQRLLVQGRGGFAAKVRTQWTWAFPIPDTLPAADVAPLFCAGITVFSPIRRYAQPVHRTAVVGVGGLGHLAIQFLQRFGCAVTAFVDAEGDLAQIHEFGAQRVLPSGLDAGSIRTAGPFDLILVCTGGEIDLEPYAAALAPAGRLHVLGANTRPLGFSADLLMDVGAAVGSSAIGSPGEMLEMLAFSARHRIVPMVEHLPMRALPEAIARLQAGKARYRIVLDADFES
ncbi:alcohol dehydrogenase [Ahniella affigens]|uniref:Alcohol dehydrogenase n=1 Tax=Ahniella affigens TaxID=2021234 RepID=A0A2P1PTY9_9GAMM|nr:NAD(P)-dependent alcohol dehydrogenase [Ahniella affigens]AVP98308.1 alcohol dehydrogenase [Ahniella affigens]